MRLAFDHIAVAAQSLEDGAAWIEQRLGVTPGPGGAHPLMGTHNRLLSLGPDSYLEIIAIDPTAAAPDRPRWFGLDVFRGPPRLVAWVARTDAALTAPPGATISAQHRGDLRWRIAIPDDGTPMAGGAWPTLIAWDGPHPAGRLPDRGLRLDRLELSAPDWPEWTDCDDPRVNRLTDPAAPPLLAVLSTPRGKVTL